MYFNIILESTLIIEVSLLVTLRELLCMYICATCLAHIIPMNSVTLIFGEMY